MSPSLQAIAIDPRLRLARLRCCLAHDPCNPTSNRSNRPAICRSHWRISPLSFVNVDALTPDANDDSQMSRSASARSAAAHINPIICRSVCVHTNTSPHSAAASSKARSRSRRRRRPAVNLRVITGDSTCSNGPKAGSGGHIRAIGGRRKPIALQQVKSDWIAAKREEAQGYLAKFGSSDTSVGGLLI